MRVRMKADLSGSRDGNSWPRRGEILDVPDDEGAQLCRSGIAAPVADDRVETAVAADPVEERAALTTSSMAAVETPTIDIPGVPEKRGPGRPRKTTE